MLEHTGKIISPQKKCILIKLQIQNQKIMLFLFYAVCQISFLKHTKCATRRANDSCTVSAQSAYIKS